MRLLKEIRSLMGSYHVKSGIYHYYRNEFKQAVEFFRRALADGSAADESERQTARFYLTETYLASAERLESKGDLEAAARDYERASEVAPAYPDIRFRLGRTMQRLGRLEEAIDQYRRAIACNEDYLDARVAVGFCLLRAGRQEEARAAFEAAMERKLRLMRTPCERALDILRSGRVAEAEELFYSAFLKQPHRFEDFYRSALEHLKAERYDDAVEQLDHALELDPTYPDLHNFRGVALCELGRVEEGITAFRRALEIRPGYQFAHLNLAFGHLRLGRVKEAETQLEAVLEQDPSQSAAATKLAEAHERPGAGEPARERPRGRPVKVRSFGFRDVGRVRDSNEDQFLVDAETGLYVVADGMGGHAAGEIASEIAVSSLGEFARGAVELGRSPTREAAREFLEEAVADANRRICDSIADHPDRRGMGTTMVAALVVGDRAFIGHVGDSRAYLLRDGQLRLLTEDHSWVNEQVRLGVLSRTEAHRHPMRNVVTRALGSRLEVLPEVREERLSPGDALMLCSDGLNVMLTDDAIRETLQPHRADPEAACRALVDAANAEGGEDNTTVVVVAVD